MSVLSKLKNRFPQGGFVRNVSVLAGGTALGQGIVILASPVLTRLYTPEDFGTLAVYSSLLGVVIVLASLKYEVAIPLPKDDVTAMNLLVLALMIVPIMSALLAVGLWILVQIAEPAYSSIITPFMWLLPIGMLLAGSYQVLNHWAVRTQAFSRISRTKLDQGLGGVSTQIILGLLDIRPLGLILGSIIGQSAGTLRLARLIVPLFNSGSLRTVSFRQLIGTARRYWRFPLITSWSSLLNSLGLRLPTLLIALLHGPQVAGWLALADRVVGTPVMLIGSATGQVYFGKAANLARTNDGQLLSLFNRITLRLFLIALALLGPLGIGGPHLFSLLFGLEWAEAGIYVQILSGVFLFRLVVGPVSQTLLILEKQHLQLAWEVFRLLLIGLAFSHAWNHSLSPSQTLGLYAVAAIIAPLALYFVILYTLIKRNSRSTAKGINS